MIERYSLETAEDKKLALRIIDPTSETVAELLQSDAE